MSRHANETDAVAAALMLPFSEGRLSWPEDGEVLLMNARALPALQAAACGGLVCEQDFKPFADALRAAGHRVEAVGGRRFELIALLVPRQREQARAGFVDALDRLRPGGVLVAAAANAQGARSAQADLQALAGPLQGLSKHHCRVFWTRPLSGATVDSDLAERWRLAAAPRRIVDGRFLSRPGLFAWDRIDPASALLAGHLPPDLAGEAADLGAGYGYLSAELAARCPGITRIDLYEAQARALELARENLAAFQDRIELGFHWHDVTTGLPARYDVILSNPPFHHDRQDDPSLGQAFIATAAAALRPGGQLYLVANRHLPYEATLRRHFGDCRELAQRDGFKLFHARGPVP